MLRTIAWYKLLLCTVCVFCFHTVDGRVKPASGTNPSFPLKGKGHQQGKPKIEVKRKKALPDSLRALDFSVTGQLLTSPPSYIRASSSLTFRVRADGSAAEAELIELVKRLANTYTLLAEGQGGVEHLLTEAGLAISGAELTKLRQRYAATIGHLFAHDQALKKALPNLAKADWISKAGEVTAFFSVPAPAYWVDLQGEQLPPRLDLKAAKGWLRASVEVKAAGDLRFDLRATSTLSSAITQQLADSPLPGVLAGSNFSSAFNALNRYQPLAMRVARLLSHPDSISKISPLVASINSAKSGLEQESAALEKASYRKTKATREESAKWLLQWLWITNGTHLTATPDYQVATNRLLYQGILKTSTARNDHYAGGSKPVRWLGPLRPDGGRVTMRHHDAARYYILANGSDAAVSAINEEQNMSLLLYNLTDKNRPAATITVSALTEDLEYYTEQFNNSGFKSINFDLSTETDDAAAKKAAIDLIDAFNRLRKLLAPFRDWSNWLIAPSQVDNTPAFRSLELPHQKPLDAPVKVAYSINDSLYKGNNTVPGIKEFSYRQNKLYRFRFKAGIVYSWLDRKEYTINSVTNTATRTTRRADPAAAVGFQIFPWRIDVRERNLAFRPFLYGGFLLDGAPAKNVLLGSGFELLTGIALTGGIHLSPGQRLVQTNGLLDKRGDSLDKGCFIQLALGLAAFNTLFKIPTAINNPFKVVP
jgi:hypothetical protein